MRNNLIHSVLRSYIALARDEHYTESELGDNKSFVEKKLYWGGELKEYFPTVQLNWTENEKFRDEICAAWNLTDEKFFEMMIIPKPTPLENLVYSAELRRIYGLGNLRFLPHFNKDGIYVLGRGNYYLKPKLKGNLISELEVLDYRELRKKAA